MKLTEAMRKKAEQYDGIDSMPQLKKLMKKLGAKDNKVRTISITFGRAYVYTYDSPSKINYNDYKWWQKLFDYAIIEGEWHKKGGIDYFIFPKKLWKDMPDIYLGLPGSDNWLIWNARCRHIPVIDISNIVYAIHQNHDYSHLGDIDDSGYRIGSAEKGMKNYLSGLETAHNRQLLPKGVSMNINDATYYLSEKGPIRKKEAADIQRYLFSLIKIYPKTKFPILIIYSLLSYYIKIKKYYNNRFVLNG